MFPGIDGMKWKQIFRRTRYVLPCLALAVAIVCAACRKGESNAIEANRSTVAEGTNKVWHSAIANGRRSYRLE